MGDFFGLLWPVLWQNITRVHHHRRPDDGGNVDKLLTDYLGCGVGVGVGSNFRWSLSR